MNPIIQAFLQAREQASRDFYAQKRMEQEKMEAETMSEWRKQQAANQAEQIRAEAERYKAEADFKKKQQETKDAEIRLSLLERFQNASKEGKLPTVTKTLEPFLDYIPQNEDYFSNEVYGKPNPLVQQTGLDKEAIARGIAALGGSAFNPEQALQTIELTAGPEDINQQTMRSAMAAAAPQFALQANTQQFTAKENKANRDLRKTEAEANRNAADARLIYQQEAANQRAEFAAKQRVAIQDRQFAAMWTMAQKRNDDDIKLAQEKAKLKGENSGERKLSVTQQKAADAIQVGLMHAERASRIANTEGWENVTGNWLSFTNYSNWMKKVSNTQKQSILNYQEAVANLSSKKMQEISGANIPAKEMSRLDKWIIVGNETPTQAVTKLGGAQIEMRNILKNYGIKFNSKPVLPRGWNAKSAGFSEDDLIHAGFNKGEAKLLLQGGSLLE